MYLKLRNIVYYSSIFMRFIRVLLVEYIISPVNSFASYKNFITMKRVFTLVLLWSFLYSSVSLGQLIKESIDPIFYLAALKITIQSEQSEVAFMGVFMFLLK